MTRAVSPCRYERAHDGLVGVALVTACMPRKTWIKVKGSVRSKGKGHEKSNVRPRYRSSSPDVIGTITAEPQLTDERTETEPNDSHNDTDVGNVASTSASVSQNKTKQKKLKVVRDLSPGEEQSMVEWKLIQ